MNSSCQSKACQANRTLTEVEIEADDVRRVSLSSHGAGERRVRERRHKRPGEDYHLRRRVAGKTRARLQ